MEAEKKNGTGLYDPKVREQYAKMAEQIPTAHKTKDNNRSDGHDADDSTCAGSSSASSSSSSSTTSNSEDQSKAAKEEALKRFPPALKEDATSKKTESSAAKNGTSASAIIPKASAKEKGKLSAEKSSLFGDAFDDEEIVFDDGSAKGGQEYSKSGMPKLSAEEKKMMEELMGDMENALKEAREKEAKKKNPSGSGGLLDDGDDDRTGDAADAGVSSMTSKKGPSKMTESLSKIKKMIDAVDGDTVASTKDELKSVLTGKKTEKACRLTIEEEEDDEKQAAAAATKKPPAFSFNPRGRGDKKDPRARAKKAPPPSSKVIDNELDELD